MVGIAFLAIIATAVIVVEGYKFVNNPWQFILKVVAGVVVFILIYPGINMLVEDAALWLTPKLEYFNALFIGIALTLVSGWLLMKYWRSHLRAVIVIPATYILNVVATLMLALHAGYDVSEESLDSAGLIVTVAILHAIILWLVYGVNASTARPERRPTFWLVSSWTAILLILFVVLMHGYSTGTITDTTRNQVQDLASMERRLQETLQEQIQQTSFEKAMADFAAAEHIGDATAMRDALIRAKEAKEETQGVQRGEVKALPPFDTIAEGASAAKKSVEDKGIIGSVASGLWRMSFGEYKPKPKPTPPPRNVALTTHKVSGAASYVAHVYNGDELEYHSPKPFRVIEMVNNEQADSHLHNECKDERPRFFTFHSLPREGVDMHILSLDGSEFEMYYRIIRR